MNRKYPRAQWHDYNSGIYFVTVCTHNRIHYFGKISEGEINHSKIGAYLCQAIEQVGLHYRNASVDRYVVMPNHFHAIISINVPVGSQHTTATVGSRHAAASESRHATASETEPNHGCLKPPRHPALDDNFQERDHFNAQLSQAIGGLKSTVTKQAHLWGMDFRWQANYHDHIIRNQREYDLISNYIDNNVENWSKDKFFKEI